MQTDTPTAKKTELITRVLPVVLLVIAVLATALGAGAIYFYRHQFAVATFGPDVAGWGQLGDFFGGVLNPTFSFLALVALLLTLYVQSKELRLSRDELEMTREELKNSADALKAQNDAINHQRFEQTFFAWLESYRALVDGIWYDPRKHRIVESPIPFREFKGLPGLEKAWEENLLGHEALMGVNNLAVLEGALFGDWREKIRALPLQFYPDFAASFRSQSMKLLQTGFGNQLAAPFSTLEDLISWVDSQEMLSTPQKSESPRVWWRL